MPEEQATSVPCPGEKAPQLALEDLVPLAAVIGAGCEPCAVRMVERALQRGSSEPSIERTLGILGELSAGKCFATAVGPEIVVRMKGALRAGRRALDHSREAPRGDRTCCG